MAFAASVVERTEKDQPEQENAIKQGAKMDRKPDEARPLQTAARQQDRACNLRHAVQGPWRRDWHPLVIYRMEPTVSMAIRLPSHEAGTAKTGN